MAQRLNITDSIQTWVDKINAALDLQNVDGSFVVDQTVWEDTVLEVTGGNVRSGTFILEIPSASLTLPFASSLVVGVNTETEVLTYFADNSIPPESFIPFYVVETNNTRITSVVDARTWAYEDSGAARVITEDAITEHETKNSAHTPAQVGADPAGTASSAIAAHESSGSAHTPAQVGADPAGSASNAEQNAKDYSVQRNNHTGTQLLSTISDAGTAAAANVGVGVDDVPKTSQADARYARLSGANDLDTMPTINGDPIVESGSNSDGSWTKWADGTQTCIDRRTETVSITSSYGPDYYFPYTWPFPATFVGDVYTDAGFRSPGSITPTASNQELNSATQANHFIMHHQSTTVTGGLSLFASGRWK